MANPSERNRRYLSLEVSCPNLSFAASLSLQLLIVGFLLDLFFLGPFTSNWPEHSSTQRIISYIEDMFLWAIPVNLHCFELTSAFTVGRLSSTSMVGKPLGTLLAGLVLGSLDLDRMITAILKRTTDHDDSVSTSSKCQRCLSNRVHRH